MRPGSDTALLTPLHPPLLLTPFSPQPRTSFSQQQLHQHIRVILQHRIIATQLLHISEATVLQIVDRMVFFWGVCLQFNMEQRRREQEHQEKQQELQQLKHKDKSQQSEYSRTPDTEVSYWSQYKLYSNKLNKLNTNKLQS